jgi:hypothetical protein
MQPSDFQRFRAVLTGMAEMYQRELSPTLLDAYWLALRGWALADFEAAAAHLMATARFMPRPADFTDLRKAARMTAAEAWDCAIAACPGWRYGTASVNPLVDRVVRMLGGYERLAMEPLDTQHFTRNKFIEFYESAGDAEETRTALPNLTSGALLAQAEAARKKAAIGFDGGGA